MFCSAISLHDVLGSVRIVLHFVVTYSMGLYALIFLFCLTYTVVDFPIVYLLELRLHTVANLAIISAFSVFNLSSPFQVTMVFVDGVLTQAILFL